MKKVLSLCLALLFCLTGLPAHAAEVGPSDWAAEEVEQAISLGFVPENLRGDYQKDITRDEFAQLAISFCQYQVGYPFGIDTFLEDYRTYHYGPDGEKVAAIPEEFSDATPYATLASALGITNGKGGGKFDPEGSITRQEAAVMLLRTYTVPGWTISDEAVDVEPYADEALFPAWATDSIMLLKAWSVMSGGGDNTFDPTGHYSREQSILTFLRLDQNAPHGRSNGGTFPLLPYEEGLQRILSPKDGATFTVAERYGREYYNSAILLGTEQTAAGETIPRLWLVSDYSPASGLRDLYPEIAKHFPAPPVLSGLSVDEIKHIMYVTATVGEQSVPYQLDLDSPNSFPEVVRPDTDRLEALPTAFDSLDIQGFDGVYVYVANGAGQAVYDLQGNRLLAADAGTFIYAEDDCFRLQSAEGLTYYTRDGVKLNAAPYAAGTLFSMGQAAVQETAGGEIMLISSRDGSIQRRMKSNGYTIADGASYSYYLLLANGDKKLMLNTATGEMLGAEYLDMGLVSAGMLYTAVRTEAGWGYVDAQFNIAIPCQYKTAYPFGLWAIVEQQNGLFGGIDKRGRSLGISFQYRSMTDLSNLGYALGLYEVDGKWAPTLVSLQTPVTLPGEDLSGYRLMGRTPVLDIGDGYAVFDINGKQLFTDTAIQGVFGDFDAGDVIIKSDGKYYLFQNGNS